MVRDKMKGYGSPPRMRGKPHHGGSSPRYERITPAHAGKTHIHQDKIRGLWDHPRACGENFVPVPHRIGRTGSPPRMRGKQKLSLGAAQLLRITPAHAGKTDLPRSRRSQHPDHPRACGENPRPFARSMSPSGSPPRMRGKRHPMFEFLRELRITPAHAGKTWVPAPKVGAFTDHPRACGENMPKSSVESASRGSPPRMRGKHFRELLLLRRERITPAHAGKTQAGKST